MMLIFIDILERLLAWLKPFTVQKSASSHFINEMQVSAVRPLNDAIQVDPAAPSEADVKRQFDAWNRSDPPTPRKSTKRCSVASNLGNQDPFIDCELAATTTWFNMFNAFGRYYIIAECAKQKKGE